MKKLLLAFLLIFGFVLSSQALAVLTPSSAVVSPVISGSSGDYYLFVPDQDGTPRIKVVKVAGTGANASTKQVHQISLSGVPYGMAVSSDNKKLYVSVNSGMSSSVKVYDISKVEGGVAAETSITSPSGMQGPAQVALTSDDKYLFVADDASHSIYVLDTAKGTYLSGSINAGEGMLYGLAIKTDGSRLAVSVNKAYPNGKVLIYDISKISQGTLPSSEIKKIEKLNNPTYLKFAPYTYQSGSNWLVSERLFVRVHGQKDIDVYSTGGGWGWSYFYLGSIAITTDTTQVDPQNKWEGMDVSPDGEWLFLTRYKDAAGTINDGVYSYVIKTALVPSDGLSTYVYAKSSDAWENGRLFIAHADSVVLGANGKTIWYAYSDGAYEDYQDAGSPYSTNSPPGKPQITYPATGAKDVMGNATWTVAWDDGGSAGLKYEVYYISAEGLAMNGNWQLLGSPTSGLKMPLDISKLQAGKEYYLKVRANDGMLSGPFDSVGPFTMAGAQISYISYISMKVNNIDTTIEAAGVTDYITIHGSGFGTPTSSQVGTAQYNVKIGGKIVQGAATKVWNDTQIDVKIPRIMQDQSYLESGTATIEVITNSLSGGSKHFRIYPQLWSVTPTKGAPGSTIDLSGLSFGRTGTAVITQHKDDSVVFRNVKLPYIIASATVISWTREVESDGTQNDKIKCTVPANLPAGDYNVFVGVNNQSSPVKTFEVSGGAIVQTTSAVIDDFEGKAVTSYDSFDVGVNKPTIKSGSYNSTNMGETTYSYASGYGGGWGGNLAATLDISKSSNGTITYDTIEYHIKPDGSSNDYHISIKLASGGKEYRGPDAKLSGIVWATETVAYSSLWYDANNNGTKEATETDTFDKSTDKSINRYNVVYTGKSASTVAHDLDDIKATKSGGVVIGGELKLTYSATKGNKYWLSIPYNNNFKDIQALADHLNGGNKTPTDVNKVTRWNPKTQKFESADYNAFLGQWNYTPDPIKAPVVVIGEAFEITIMKDTVIDLAKLGTNNTTFKFNLTYNKGGTLGNKNWISVPYTVAAADLQKLADEMNGTTTVDEVSKVTRWNFSTQKFESADYNAFLGQWNYTPDSTKAPVVVVPEGFEVTLDKDLTWTPKTK